MLYEVTIEGLDPFDESDQITLMFDDGYDDLDYANYILNGFYEGRDINKPFIGKILAYESPNDIRPIGMKRIIA